MDIGNMTRLSDIQILRPKNIPCSNQQQHCWKIKDAKTCASTKGCTYNGLLCQPACGLMKSAPPKLPMPPFAVDVRPYAQYTKPISNYRVPESFRNNDFNAILSQQFSNGKLQPMGEASSYYSINEFKSQK